MTGEDEDKSAFAARVQRLADHAKNASELARRTGLSRAAIDKYTSATSEPSRFRLIALADAMGVSLSWLVAGRGPMFVHDADDLGFSAFGDRAFLSSVSDRIAAAYEEEGVTLVASELVIHSISLASDIVAVATKDDERDAALATSIRQLKRKLAESRDGADHTRRGPAPD